MLIMNTLEFIETFNKAFDLTHTLIYFLKRYIINVYFVCTAVFLNIIGDIYLHEK